MTRTKAFIIAALMFVGGPVLALTRTNDSSVLRSIPTMDELAGKWLDASTLLAMPAMNNADGSAEASRGMLSVDNLSFPPVTMTGNTGTLTIGGRPTTLEQTRWYPYQVLRKGREVNLAIETAVRMVYDNRALLFHLVLTNDGTTEQVFKVGVNLTANTSEHSHWGWQIPRPEEPDRFSAVAVEDGRTLLLKDSEGQLANCFSFEKKPDQLKANAHSGEAIWNVVLQPGQRMTVNYSLAVGYKDEQVQKLSEQLAENFESAFRQVKTDWQNRFDAMFTPHNKYFSGYLPTLVTSDSDMSRMYYMSAASLLCMLRTGFPIAPRVYVSNSPQSNCTMVYFWDTSEWATTFALLDPAMLKEYLRSWISKGIYDGYSEEYLTGTLQGPWYSANDLSIFRLINAYLNVTGDTSFLKEKIAGKTVLEHLLEIATHWKSLVRPGHTLADYGGASNLLECVPTYINEVASFNAANVEFMRRVADIEDVYGSKSVAARLRREADHLYSAVLKLYVPGKGIWYTIHSDGKRVPVHTVFDFATVGLTIGQDLPDSVRAQMLHFVESELITKHWMRALSLTDEAASASNRPDHGPMGAYCAWPAETMRVMCLFGKYKTALDFLNNCTAVTYEGPFSQSREMLGRSDSSTVRIAPAPQPYNASNGVSFVEAILRGFFGYRPDFLNKITVPDPAPRGFLGELLNVRQGNRVLDISSTANGIEVSPAK